MNAKSLVAMLLCGAAHVSACSNEQFNSVNQSLAGVNKISEFAGGGDARIPTAAISTAIGAMEMIKAFSSGSNAGGGLISAGGQSYQLLQLRPSLTTTTAIIKERGVDAQVTYKSEVTGAKAVTTIEEFAGTSQGYYLYLSGMFEYDASVTPPRVSCFMTGNLVQQDRFAVRVSDLNFNTTDPLPRDGELGSFQLRNDWGEFIGPRVVSGRFIDGEFVKRELEYDATVSVRAGKIEATSTFTKDGVRQPGTIKFGEDMVGQNL